MSPVKSCAVGLAFCLLATGVIAQTSPDHKITPGNDVTKAVGSQVPTEKVECTDKAVTTPQAPHAPSATVGGQVPTMTQPNCPDGKPAEPKK